MGKPSMFSKDYHRVMRKRKIVFRTVIVIAALVIIFFTYNKSAVVQLKKLVEDFKITARDNSIDAPREDGLQEDSEGIPDSPEEDTKEPSGIQEEPPEKTEGSLAKFPGDESITIVYEEVDGVIKFTGINSDNMDIYYDIRNDGKAIVFDNPRTSDIWIYNADRSYKKLNPDYYKQSGNEGLKFDKAEIMKRYNNTYVWAAKPKFLQDGRIVYQSNLPWFKETNTYYLWMVLNNGEGNRMVLGTGKSEPPKYQGFTDDGRLIVEFGGVRYALDPDTRDIDRVD